jgi:tRNA(adenine34) deaminase
MRLALGVAADAAVRGEVPVGAVVLDRSGAVIASGGNEREMTGDVAAHAEIVAMRRAAEALGQGWRLPGCTMVVTLEPCVMCAGAIVAARLERVVYGAFDPKAGAVTSLWDLLGDPRLLHRPSVVSGVMADAVAAQLKGFFAERRD